MVRRDGQVRAGRGCRDQNLSEPGPRPARSCLRVVPADRARDHNHKTSAALRYLPLRLLNLRVAALAYRSLRRVELRPVDMNIFCDLAHRTSKMHAEPRV